MSDFREDDVIGGYRVLRPLGRGGMGAVYEVEHVQLGVHYALKAFARESRHAGLLREKFLAEGKVLARLRHPRLVRVFDLGFDERTGAPYFVMDLVLDRDGSPRTLADVALDSLDEETVRGWFGELAEALDYIHGQGVVHRDVKLGNVLLGADGHVVLSDFGVSRLLGGGMLPDVPNVETAVSATTVPVRLLMGTRPYMAPEVLRGEPATPASDVYALGVLLLYLLTGMWHGRGVRMGRILSTYGYDWGSVLSGMLSESPDGRPEVLADAARRLAARDDADCPEGGGAESPPRGPSRGRRALLLAAAAAVFAVLALVTLGLLRAASSRVVEDDFAELFGSGGIYGESR